MTGAERPSAYDQHIATPEAFRLTSLLRCLEWAVVGSDEALLVAQAWESLQALYLAVNRREIENDYNKHYIFRLIERVTLAEPSVLTLFASSPAWIQYWITLRESPIGYEYNNKVLQPYFRVMLRACQASAAFREALQEHRNFTWAFQVRVVAVVVVVVVVVVVSVSVSVSDLVTMVDFAFAFWFGFVFGFGFWIRLNLKFVSISILFLDLFRFGFG
jgi:hypothetical protein